jgi:type 1 glutamine amidotransferase
MVADPDARTRVLVVTGGHPFEAEPFFEVFDANSGIDWTHASQPDAQAYFTPDRAAEWDVIVLYDMPGIEFTRGDPPARFPEPTTEYMAAFEALLEAGKGMIFLHHSIAGWPAWDRYAEIVGGRFHYQPATLAGTDYPDSGYRFDVTHTVSLLDPEHPICADLPASFEITDELYLFPVFETAVEPLMESSFEFESDSFYSADLAIRGERSSNAGWAHPSGSNLVAWVHAQGNSPLAYLQFGDGPLTYADPHYRIAIGNAIRWAASEEAHRWAQGYPEPDGPE